MHEVLVNHLGGLSLPRKSVVRLTDRPDMTLDVYRGRKTTKQKKKKKKKNNVPRPLCVVRRASPTIALNNISSETARPRALIFGM